MPQRFHAHDNADLVRYLKANQVIRSAEVERVMLQVDRGKYSKNNPYMDSPQRIGFGVTISAPHMHAHALQLLSNHLKKGNRALDIGSGSGYLTACMGHMVGETGRAVGIDLVPELIKMAQDNIENDSPQLMSNYTVKLVVGDGRQGHPNEAPYNAIHVGAAAPTLPLVLVEQLALGGRLIIPIGPEGANQNLEQIDKLEDGCVKRQVLMGVLYGSLKDKN